MRNLVLNRQLLVTKVETILNTNINICCKI